MELFRFESIQINPNKLSFIARICRYCWILNFFQKHYKNIIKIQCKLTWGNLLFCTNTWNNNNNDLG